MFPKLFAESCTEECFIISFILMFFFPHHHFQLFVLVFSPLFFLDEVSYWVNLKKFSFLKRTSF